MVKRLLLEKYKFSASLTRKPQQCIRKMAIVTEHESTGRKLLCDGKVFAVLVVRRMITVIYKNVDRLLYFLEGFDRVPVAYGPDL